MMLRGDQLPPAPEEVYGYFVQPVNQESVRSCLQILAHLSQRGGIRKVHLAVTSSGGIIADGLALYAAFKSLPLELAVYNISSVQSIAAIAFLAAPERIASPHASFMLHRSTISAQDTTGAQLAGLAEYLAMEDSRIADILKQHLDLDAASWDKMQSGDLYISPERALECGLIHRIDHFSPAPGNPFFTV